MKQENMRHAIARLAAGFGVLAESRWFGIIAASILLALLMAFGAIRPIDDALERMRFSAVQHQPSQNLTVVEIDNASLRAASHWPWARTRYAVAIRNLRKAGASVIGFDVDFSAKSNPTHDAALRDAINEQAGDVVLPVFMQTFSAARREFLENRPQQALAQNALLGSVNVELEPDGKVRHYTRGGEISGDYRPSMASSLLGDVQTRGRFLIDYGIRTTDLPRLSFKDVFRGDFDPSLVKGRVILVGATAVELGDHFVTPVSPNMPGVYVHALAYESMLAQRALVDLRGWPAFVFALLVFAALWPRQGELNLRRAMLRHAIFFAAAISLPVVLQSVAPVSLPAGALLAAQIICVVQAVRVELARRARELVVQREEYLLRLTLQDAETELPNRRALVAEIEKQMHVPDHGVVAAVTIGIDRYAMLRSAIGFASYNELVRNFAARLSANFDGATVAHVSTAVLGLTFRAPSVQAALEFHSACMKATDTRIDVAGHKVDVLFHTGIAMDEQVSAEPLLENAKRALDDAIARNLRMVVYDAQNYDDPTVNLSMVGDMVRGIKHGEFSLQFQPKLALDSNRIVSAEALMRWDHPERGRIAPDRFIETAEETGTIRVLTEWVLHEAIFNQLEMRARGHDVTIAINISARLLCDASFCDTAIAAVQESGAKLSFEITETAVIEDPLTAMSAIASYREAGIKIAIDDYGSGYSSVSYLKQIPADELKIDRSLIVDLGKSVRDQMILRSTIDLAHGLGLSVVVEGVEDEVIMNMLRSMRCDMVQGFVVSRSLPLDEFCDLRAELEVRAAAAQEAGQASKVKLAS